MYLKIDLQFQAPLVSLFFFLRKIFLMWAGGWVSQNPGGAHLSPHPPPITKQRLGVDGRLALFTKPSGKSFKGRFAGRHVTVAREFFRLAPSRRKHPEQCMVGRMRGNGRGVHLLRYNFPAPLYGPNA